MKQVRITVYMLISSVFNLVLFSVLISCFMGCSGSKNENTPAPAPEQNQQPQRQVTPDEALIQKADVVLNPKNIIPSRFDCKQSIMAAEAATEAYQVDSRVAPNGNTNLIKAKHDPKHFDIFQAKAGGTHATAAYTNFGFVEYIPSALEVALDNTPGSVQIDFANIDTHREARLIFRGTLGGFNENEWLTNRDMSAGQTSSFGGVGVVHNGFLDVYLSAMPTVHSYFDQSFVNKSNSLEAKLRSRLNADGRFTQTSIDQYVKAVLEDYQVLISGHSLGGALATLAAYDFSIQYPQFRNKMTLITFAAPAVLYGIQPGDSLHQFSTLIARGTQYGHTYSAVFFERDQDMVSDSTQSQNYSTYFPGRGYLYDGSTKSFAGRPSNSGVAVKLHKVSGTTLVGWLVSVFTANIVTPNPGEAHSMSGYRDDIVAYCQDMNAKQGCLNFDSLDSVKQADCASQFGMDQTRSTRYQSELSQAGKVHVMDHPDFDEIPRK